MRPLPCGVKTIRVNGCDMAYLECGQGDPLVLVHGSLGDYRVWEQQMEAFGRRWRTIAVSLRHAYPHRWDGQCDICCVDRHADDLSVFIQRLGALPVHLVAHSRGGDVALMLASKRPDLIGGLVLADPAPINAMLAATAEIHNETLNRRAFVTSALERMGKGDVDGALEAFTDAVTAPGTWKKLPESAKQMRRDNAWSLKSLVRDAQKGFNSEDAAKIDAPVLLVTGDRSPRIYGLMHEALALCLKTRHKVTIPQASHGMYRDNPEAFNTAVIDFLGKCTGIGRPW